MEARSGKARVYIEALPILREPSASVQPSRRSFDGPPSRQHDYALPAIGSFDDFDLGAAEHALRRFLEFRPLITAVGMEFEQEREQPKQAGKQHGAAVAILDFGGGHDGVQHETLGIHQAVPLLALDLLASVVPRRIVGPPFSALLTLWESITAAVGLASRPIASRHFT